jgi:hypothetical protein
LKTFRGFIFLTFSCLFIPAAFAQTSASDGKKITNVISFNIGQYLVNEINLGYEYFLSENKSIELNGGLIYQNQFLMSLSEDWINSQYFREQGFAVRAYYKTYKKSNEKKNSKTFYSFGLNYQYLFFNEDWFDTGKTFTLDSNVVTVPPHPYKDPNAGDEQVLMHRLRHRIGVQLLLGNVLPMGSNFFLEFYYGLGLRGIFSRRTDVARITTIDGSEYYQDLNSVDNSFYVRPTIHAGVKLKLGW